MHATRSRARGRPRDGRPATRTSSRRPRNMLGHVEHAAGDSTPPTTCSPAAVKASGRCRSPGVLAMPLPAWRAVALATGDDGQAERLLDEAVSVLRPAGRGSCC